MEKGWKNRSVGATEMNADSSRSHSIFTISIEMMSTGNILIFHPTLKHQIFEVKVNFDWSSIEILHKVCCQV